MRTAVVLLILATVLGGCSDDVPPPGDPPELPPQPPPGTNATPPPPGAEWFNFSLAEQTYNHSLQRYQLTALGPGVVDIGINGSIGALGFPSNCAVAAVAMRSSADEDIASGGVIVWAAGETNYVAAEVAGRGFGTPTDNPSGSSAPSSHSIGAAVEVAPGDRLIVELGGADPIMMNGTFTPAGDGAAVQANFLNVSVRTSGPVEWTSLPARNLRCGSGTAGLDTHAARVEAPRVEAAARGWIGLNTTAASTLLFFHSAGPSGGFNAADVTFLDQTHSNPRALALTAPQAGHLGIKLDRWVGVGAATPLWLLADTHWPFVAAIGESG